MGLLLRSLAMLFLLVCFSWLPGLKAQSTNGSSRSNARALDALLQDYAYRAFRHPKTGIPFDGDVPLNLTGIKVAGMRLRSGSLYRRGVAMYKEFKIPIGVTESPYVERLVFVYQNLGNWSKVYYPLVGYTYLAPVLGLLAYDASNLLATNLPELDIRASMDGISIIFPNVQPAPSGTVAKCVWFALNGSVNYSNLTPGNICSTFQQGHFSIVVESVAPSPEPVPPSPGKREEKKNNSKVWIIVGSVVGGLALLVLSAFLVLWVQKYKQRKKMQQMERAAEVGEALHMTSVGNTRAPAATGTRTQPVLESELVP